MLVPEWDLWGQSWVLATELSYPGLSWARLLPRGLLYTKRTSSSPAVNPAWPEALLRICRKCSLSVYNPISYLLAYVFHLVSWPGGSLRVTAQLTTQVPYSVLTMSDFPPIVSWDANYVMKMAWTMQYTAHACHSSFRAIWWETVRRIDCSCSWWSLRITKTPITFRYTKTTIESRLVRDPKTFTLLSHDPFETRRRTLPWRPDGVTKTQFTTHKSELLLSLGVCTLCKRHSSEWDYDRR